MNPYFSRLAEERAQHLREEASQGAAARACRLKSVASLSPLSARLFLLLRLARLFQLA